MVDPAQKFITWAALSLSGLSIFALLAVTIVLVELDSGEPVVIEISQPQVLQEDGSPPTVEGVLPPSILVSFETCLDPTTGINDNCTTVPIVFDRVNLTDETIEVMAQGIWSSFVVDGSLNVIGDTDFTCVRDRTQKFPLIPGSTPSQLNAHPDQCVLDRVSDLAAEGVYTSVWSLTSILDPIGVGRTSEVDSQNFTLVHPDWAEIG